MFIIGLIIGLTIGVVGSYIFIRMKAKNIINVFDVYEDGKSYLQCSLSLQNEKDLIGHKYLFFKVNEKQTRI